MSHFAKVVNNIVADVIVADQTFINTLPDASSYIIIPDSITKGYPAGIGYSYDAQNQVFEAPQPYPSWVKDSNFIWQAPTAYPTDGKTYGWDELTKTWKEF